MNETIGVAHTCEHEWHLFAQKFKYLALNRFPMHHCYHQFLLRCQKLSLRCHKIICNTIIHSDILQ